jgi:ABC-type transport system involved in multi-copper enzyme maturation permease subunit
MFAALSIERDPLGLGDIPAGVIIWIQDVGGFALFGILLYLILGVSRWEKRDYEATPLWMKTTFIVLTILSVLCVSVGAMIAQIPDPNPRPALKAGELPPRSVTGVANTFTTIGGLAALTVVAIPFFGTLAQLSFRRIYALALLSFKEALRRRVLYAFSALLIVFLFGSWFITSKPQDQVRTYVWVVFYAMSALLFLTAIVLSAFSIPTDIRQQTIHTVVTKPVERFEIILGRFLGVMALMTLVLVVMSSLSLIYVLRGVNPQAAAESLMARVPLYGDRLRYENTETEGGINVGREWEYRGYITAALPGQPVQRAIWEYDTIPSYLGDFKEVRCEYTFDVYRTTTGFEGRDVSCLFRFYTWRWRERDLEDYRKEAAKPDADRDILAEKFGYYEIPAQEVTDYLTQSFTLPAGLFRNAAQPDPERESELKERNQPKIAFTVAVSCNSVTQYVGMARYDFYIRADAPDPALGEASPQRFGINFLKASFGLWLQIALLSGVAVTLSTQLNGVISAMASFLIYLGGLAKPFIAAVSAGINEGGGPMEAVRNIANRSLSTVRGDESTGAADQLIRYSDDAFRLLMQRLLNLNPDVAAFDFTRYAGEGFNVPFDALFIGTLLLVGYLIPWFVLGFYLLRWREIAGST